MEKKYWYDASNDDVVPVRDHHWTDVEADPESFAEFDEDDLETVMAGESSQDWLKRVVFAAGWVRVTLVGAVGYFEGMSVKDVRKAMRTIVGPDTERVVVDIVDPAVGHEGQHIDIAADQIASFIRSGRPPHSR